MARGINKVIIVGNAGSDPEQKTTKSGSSCVTLSVATSEAWKDKQSGQMNEKTEWHRIVFYGRLSEIVMQYVKKGSKVYVEGKSRTNEYVDNNNIKRYSHSIVANEMQMLDSSRGDSQNSQHSSQFNVLHNNDQYQPSNPQLAPQQNSPSSFDDFDDDIPF